jgi:NAD+ synthase (glutamine-hydrolysing)
MIILAAQLNPTIGDFPRNTAKILEVLSQNSDADLIVFSELAICGYPPEDLLLLPDFVSACETALQTIAAAVPKTAIIGTLKRENSYLYNCAAVITGGQIEYVKKRLLPTYDVFDEQRYFKPGHETKTFEIAGKKVGITVCEDLWSKSDRMVFSSYDCDPVADYLPHKIDLLINISASPYSMQKKDARLNVVRHAATTLTCPVLLCNQVGGNDSLIFDGHSLYVGANGDLLAQGKSFEEDQIHIDTEQTGKALPYPLETDKELYNALVLGLRDYFHKLGFKRAMLGLSGGIDSALVACLGAAALGPENLLGVTMPSRYSSQGSVADSDILAKNLGIEHITVPIEEPFKSYEKLLAPVFGDKPADVTEENLQARIRGMILMAISNKFGYLVLSTGNKSEMAMGYSTLYGDMCGGLSVINDVTKLQVYSLARWINEQWDLIPPDILSKPPSASSWPE